MSNDQSLNPIDSFYSNRFSIRIRDDIHNFRCQTAWPFNLHSHLNPCFPEKKISQIHLSCVPFAGVVFSYPLIAQSAQAFIMHILNSSHRFSQHCRDTRRGSSVEVIRANEKRDCRLIAAVEEETSPGMWVGMTLSDREASGDKLRSGRGDWWAGARVEKDWAGGYWFLHWNFDPVFGWIHGIDWNLPTKSGGWR